MLKIKKFALLSLLIFSSSFVFAQDYDPVALNKCQEMWSDGFALICSNDFGASECEAILQNLPVQVENPTPEDIVIFEIFTTLIYEDYDNCLVEVEVKFYTEMNRLAEAVEDCISAAEIEPEEP